MNYWIITDTHLGHTELRRYGRPDNCDEQTLKNLKRMDPKDVLIHLGDVCIRKDAEWHEKLMDSIPACRRWLVLGNHDNKSINWYLRAGWDFVGNEMLLDVFGKRILFTHKPVIRPGYDLNIHGHFHNTMHHKDPTDARSLLVFMEHRYKPQNLRHLVEKACQPPSASPAPA